MGQSYYYVDMFSKYEMCLNCFDIQQYLTNIQMREFLVNLHKLQH